MAADGVPGVQTKVRKGSEQGAERQGVQFFGGATGLSEASSWRSRLPRSQEDPQWQWGTQASARLEANKGPKSGDSMPSMVHPFLAMPSFRAFGFGSNLWSKRNPRTLKLALTSPLCAHMLFKVRIHI